MVVVTVQGVVLLICRCFWCSGMFMPTVREWTIEMFWKCPNVGCGKLNPGMSGAERESLRCVNCGYEKRESDPWIMPENAENAPALTGDLEKKANSGENWSCSHCKAESRNNFQKCEVCGAPRYEENTHPKAERLEAGWSSADPDDIGEEPVQTAVPDPKPPVVTWVPSDDILKKPEKTPFFNEVTVFPLAMLAVVVLVGFALWFFLTPHHSNVSVTDMRWSRVIDVDERHSHSGEGWRNQAPSQVFSWDHCESRQSGTRRCNPHRCNPHSVSYECRCSGGDSYSCHCRNVCKTSCSSNRNGSARCSESCSERCSTCRTPRRCQTCTRTEYDTCYDQCPVYEDWCRYRYYTWDRVDHEEAYGVGTSGIRWPEAASATVNPDNPRRSELHESYAVTFSESGSDPMTWRRNFSLERYQSFSVGQRYQVEWTRSGGFTILQSLGAAR